MDEYIQHGPVGWFFGLAMGGVALFLAFRRARRTDRREESEAGRQEREADARAEAERRRAAQQERADDISREVTRVMEGYKEYLAAEKRRHDTDRKANADHLRALNAKLEAVQAREQECREEQARQDEQIRHQTEGISELQRENTRQQERIERNTTELETLKDMLAMHGIRLRSGPYPAAPSTGSGPHRAPPASPDGTERRKGGDSSYCGPERRQPK